MEKFLELERLVASMKKDINKFFYKNNFEASIRIRKTLQDVKRISQELRMDISKRRNDDDDDTNK